MCLKIIKMESFLISADCCHFRCFTFNHTVVSGTERRDEIEREREHLRFRPGLGDRLLHFQHSSGKRSSLN